jgi:two-component system, OmpR family, response regulator
MAKKIILLGEDENDIAEMYRIVFEKMGYEIIIAIDGDDVINKAKENNLDLLLLDINMPNKDGFEVLKEAAEDPDLYKALNHVPIIILSNYNNPQDIDYCIRLGAQDYFVKSEWTPEKIVEKVKKYLKE